MHTHNLFPVAEQIVSMFVAWLHARQLAVITVNNYLAVVCHTQIALGLQLWLGNPRMGDMPQLEYVIRGMKRKLQVQTRTRLPVTPEVLRGLKLVWQRLRVKGCVNAVGCINSMFLWLPRDRRSVSANGDNI